MFEMNWRKWINNTKVEGYVATIISVSYIYILWIVSHYIASHLYIRFCVSATLMGFLTAPFMVAAPHCKALRWVIYTGGEKIFAMWVIIGSWIINIINNQSPIINNQSPIKKKK